MFEIIGKPQGEIDVKRFYLDGVKIKTNCPKCDHDIKMDLGDDYLKDPEFNDPFTFPMYCCYCGYEWNEKVILEVELKKAKS